MRPYKELGGSAQAPLMEAPELVNRGMTISFMFNDCIMTLEPNGEDVSITVCSFSLLSQLKGFLLLVWIMFIEALKGIKGTY